MPDLDPIDALPSGDSARTPPDWLALAGGAATAALHFILQARGPNPYFIAGACLAWATFIGARAWQDRSALRDWGFRLDNILPASAIPAALLFGVALAFAAFAHAQGNFRFPKHVVSLFVLFPIWGVVQQFLMLAIVAGNLNRIERLGHRRAIVVAITALIFGLLHAYDLRLAGATFVFECAIAPLYLRRRNLWPLGILHGWLGALFYLWVLGRDLHLENFRTEMALG